MNPLQLVFLCIVGINFLLQVYNVIICSICIKKNDEKCKKMYKATKLADALLALLLMFIFLIDGVAIVFSQMSNTWFDLHTWVPFLITVTACGLIVMASGIKKYTIKLIFHCIIVTVYAILARYLEWLNSTFRIIFQMETWVEKRIIDGTVYIGSNNLGSNRTIYKPATTSESS